MNLSSYELSRQFSYSNPRKEMLREKEMQIRNLYEFAMDREDDTLLNRNAFIKSPRIFDRKFVDSTHHKITVETILKEDWMECGDYLEYDGMVWLCLNSYSFHKLYCRATFMSCDWQIYWIDDNGKLKSQYVIDQNSTQYNSGESGNSTITLGAAQHMLRMQCNEDTIKFDSPQRFVLDKNMKKPTCYKVTQNDNTSYNYGKGLCCVTVAETQLNTETDKLVTLNNGKKVWICDYNKTSEKHHLNQPVHSKPNETTILNCEIKGSKTLRCGIERTYTAILIGNDGIKVDEDIFRWNIISNFKVDQSIDGNKIKLLVENEELIDSSFILQVIQSENNAIIAELEITIVDLM